MNGPLPPLLAGRPDERRSDDGSPSRDGSPSAETSAWIREFDFPLLLIARGRVAAANPAACNHFGSAEDALRGLPAEFLLSDVGRDGTGRPPREWTILEESDEDGVALALSLAPFAEADKRGLATILLQRFRSRQTERELRHMFDLSLDLLCVAGMDGRFRRVNPSFTRVLGYSIDELLRDPFLCWVHPDDVEPTVAVMGTLSQGEPTICFRNRYRTKAGAYRVLEWNAVAVPDDQVIYAVARDLTEHVAMEEKLRQRESRERAILDHTSAVIYVKDVAGHYEFVNRTYAELFGVDAASVAGRTDYDIFPPRFADAFSANDREVIRSREPVRCEECAPHQDGVHTYFSIKVPLTDEGGAVRAVAGISTDMTEHLRARKLEEDIRLARIVQQRLFPARDPRIPGFDIAGTSAPMSQLCGDYFDFIFSEDRRKLFLAVGDVSGHGLGPALKMVEIRAILRLLLSRPCDLASAVRQVNQTLLEDSPESYFITLFVLELDLEAHVCRHVGIGHDAWRIGDRRAVRLPSDTFPLGIAAIDDLQAAPETAIRSGDLFALFTDGLTEAMNAEGEAFGTQRVLDLVRQQADASADVIVDSLLTAAYEHSAGAGPHDDITVIIAKAA